jgi:hypothetical protein
MVARKFWSRRASQPRIRGDMFIGAGGFMLKWMPREFPQMQSGAMVARKI